MLSLVIQIMNNFTSRKKKSSHVRTYTKGSKIAWTNLSNLCQGIVVFASVMATLGIQILLESARELISKVNKFDYQLIQKNTPVISPYDMSMNCCRFNRIEIQIE